MELARSGEALGARYRFVERVGADAVGEVWTVSSKDQVTLAAKLLRPEHADDPALVERFVRERSVLRTLDHPHIVAVRDIVVEGSRPATDRAIGGVIGLANTAAQPGGADASDFVSAGIQGSVQGASGPSAGRHAAGW